MPSYTLHAPPASFRAFKALIVAEYNGIEVNVADPFDAAIVKALSPTGKAPVLTSSVGASIFESNAIARFLAKLRRDTHMMGNGSIQEEAIVDSWMDFSTNNLELPATVWFYPAAGYMPFSADAYAKAKEDLAKGLAVLDTYLLDKTYLVGDAVTLADISVVSTLLYPFKLVCDKSYLKPFGNVTRWFNTCVNQPEFKAVVGEVVLCKKEILPAGAEKAMSGGGGKAKKEGKKEGKKKEKAAAPAPAPAPKKVEHPYKIMDKEKPSPFNNDAWKKTYSNAKTYDDAMAAFWDMFDTDGWSLWYQVYDYNAENKRAFMAANAVGGFQQRTDEIRKWAFGVMDVLGSEESGVLEIKGVWLLRGDTVDHMKNANDDANWYTWTKLAGPGLPPTDEVKAKVAAFWCSEEELEGKPICDSKVFK